MTTGGLAVTARAPAPPVVLTWGLVFAVGAMVLLAGALSAPPAVAVAWGSCALAAWCTAFLCLTAAAAGRDGLGLAQWKLGAWSLTWFAVTSGLATAVWSPLQQATAAQLTAISVLRALWLVAVAMTALSAGYCAGPRKFAGKYGARVTAALSSRSTSSVQSPAVLWLLCRRGVCRSGGPAGDQRLLPRYCPAARVEPNVADAHLRLPSQVICEPSQLILNEPR